MKFIINSLLIKGKDGEEYSDSNTSFYIFSVIQMPDEFLDFDLSGIDKIKDLGIFKVILTEKDPNFDNFMQAYYKKDAVKLSSEIVF